jgi:hypothetical protein
MAGLGAILTLDVHVPPAIANALTASNQPVPPAVSGITLVDTGATMTCVHEAILTGLGLQPVGQVQSGTANGPVQQNVYMTRLVFPLLGWTVDLPVAGVDLTGQQAQLNPPQDIIALLGRNLLRNCVLIWNGVGGFWSIST